MSWSALDAIQYSKFGHYNNFLFIYILQQSALILLQLNFILWNEILCQKFSKKQLYILLITVLTYNFTVSQWISKYHIHVSRNFIVQDLILALQARLLTSLKLFLANIHPALTYVVYIITIKIAKIASHSNLIPNF